MGYRVPRAKMGAIVPFKGGGHGDEDVLKLTLATDATRLFRGLVLGSIATYSSTVVL